MVSVSNSTSGKTDQSQQPPRPGEGIPLNANGWLPPLSAAAGLPLPGAPMMGIAGFGAGSGELPFAARFPPPGSLDLPAVREEYLRLWRESLLAQQQQARQQQQQAGLAATLLPETYHFLSRLLAATPAYFYEPLDPNRNGSFFSDLLRSLVAKVRYTEEAQAAAAAAAANPTMSSANMPIPPHHIEAQMAAQSQQLAAGSSEGSFNHQSANKRPRLSTPSLSHQGPTSSSGVKQENKNHGDAKHFTIPAGSSSSSAADDDKLEVTKHSPMAILKPIPVPPLPVTPRFLQTPSFKLGIPALTAHEPGNLKKRKLDSMDDNSSREAGASRSAGFDTRHGQVSSAFQPFTASSSADDSNDDSSCQEDATRGHSGLGQNSTSTGKVLKNLRSIYESVHDSLSKAD